jgi:pimeloyl-ACP methyl ester carboxylesterase
MKLFSDSLLALALLLAVSASSQTPQTASSAGSSGPTKSFAVQVVGQGKPMLLIPGLTCGGDVWNTTVAHYKDRYQCHVLTLAGFAGQPSISAPMMETIRNDIAQYIRDKKLAHPVIVGHSLGGFLAYWLAASEPDLVGPIISVDGGTFLPALLDPTVTAASAKSNAEMMRQMMASQPPEAFASQNKMFLSSMIIDPKNVDLIAPTCAKSDPKAVALAMYELMTTDLRDQVSRIKSPVLLIAGGELITSPDSNKTVTANYESQVAKIPNHKVVVADKAKHFVMLDDPTFFFSTMDDFLKSSGS